MSQNAERARAWVVRAASRGRDLSNETHLDAGRDGAIEPTSAETAVRQPWRKPEIILTEMVSTEGISINPGDGISNLC
jgi:hypothetical protein